MKDRRQFFFLPGRGGRERAGRYSPGFAMYEMALGVFLVFALLLGMLILVTWENDGTEKTFGVSPYRAMYAGYINNRLKEWTSAVLSFRDMNGALPGDAASPSMVNSMGQTIGDNNGRVEREKEENLKFFTDLFNAGLANEPRVRLRSVIMDFYWVDFSRNGGRGKAGNYFKLPGIHPDEALAVDHNYDDGDPAAGNVLFFPNPDGTVDLFYLFNPY